MFGGLNPLIKNWNLSNPNTILEMTLKKCMLEGCSQKLGLTNMPCKCENTYCSKHRHSEDHDCKYNYKQNQKELLSTQMIKVAGSKIDKV